jgi:hypothetical protein
MSPPADGGTGIILDRIEVEVTPKRRRSRLPEVWFDTTDPGWLGEALQFALDGDDLEIYDWPQRRWVVIPAAWFDPQRPYLRQLKRFLRDEGIVPGRDGRRQ